jgi:hypothetical protein
MYNYKLSLLAKLFKKKSEPYIILNTRCVFLPKLNMEFSIKDINSIKLVNKKIHVRHSYKFIHTWILVVGKKEVPIIEHGQYHKKDIKKLIEELKSLNPNIALEDGGMLSQPFKIFDKTVNSSIYEADKKAAFHNKTLDDLLGLFSVGFIIMVCYGFTHLSKRFEYNYFGFTDGIRVFLMVISGVFISLTIVNELIAPFIKAYLGRVISILTLIIGLLILFISI